MPAFLVQIDGYDPVAAAAVTLYASSLDDERVCHLNGQTWWPVISKLPALRYDLVDAGFSGRIETPGSSLGLGLEPWPNFARYALADARLRLWSGEPGEAWASWVLRFDGRVTSQPATSGGYADIPFAVDDRWLDTPLLPLYAGTTGAEGPAALKGQPKPLAIGAPRYCPAVPIDTTNLVFQISAYAVQGVDSALERLLAFEASVGNYASYATLVAASIPPGKWGTAVAVGMVRHGAPPAGKLSYQVRGDNAGADGWVRLPGSVIKRLALLAGGAGKTHDASLTALNASRPWNISWLLRDQITAREAIQRIAASVNAVAGVTWLGQLFVAPLPDLSAAATITLDSSGASLPMVAKVDQLPVDPPFWRLAIEAERTEEVHGFEEAAGVTVDRGDYVAGESYREGHLVEHQNMRWRYIAAAPSSGNAPPTLPTTSNAWWEALDPKLAGISDGATRNVDRIYDPFTYATLAEILLKWKANPSVTNSGELSIVADSDFPGGFALEVGNNAGTDTGSFIWDAFKLPYEKTDGLYEVSMMVKQVSGGAGQFYGGICGYAADGTTLVNYVGSNSGTAQHWVFGNGITIPATATTYKGYVKGTAGTGSVVAKPDKLAPGVMHTNTAFIVPIFLCNFGVAGRFRIGMASLQKMPGAFEEGADITANANPVHVLPADPTVHYDSALAAKTNELPRNLFVRRFKGATEVTQDNDTAWSIVTSGCTATINNTNGSGIKGKIIITAAAAAGWIEVNSTKAGAASLKDRITVTKDVDAPGSGGGVGATGFDVSVTGSVTSTNSAAPTVIASGATMRSSSGGQIVFRGEFYYEAIGAPGSSVTVFAKWQKSLAGAATWSDVSFGYSTGGTSVTDADGAANTQACSVAGTATGLTASTDYDLRLVAYRSGTSTASPWVETILTGRQS